jgi:hypothetical protein
MILSDLLRGGFMSTIYKTVSTDVDVEVEISLDDFNKDELMDMLIEDGFIVVNSYHEFDQESFNQQLEKLCYLFRANDERFKEEIRIFLSKLSGKVL